MAFGVLTGSAMATISSIGKMIHPQMVRRGYTPEYAGALIAATCFLGILIPPSIPGIMYALSSGQSISDVWLSTVGPGVLIGIAYIIYNYFSGGKKDKSVADTKGVLEYFAKIGHKTWSASPAIIMPIIIFGGIYGGVFTPTEAGAVCMAYGVGFYFVKRAFKKDSVSSSMWLIFLTGGLATATICIIQIFANTASRAISLAGITQALAEFIVANVSATWQYLLICNVIFLILGCLIDITSAVLMMTPLLLPTTLAMGIDPIHFGGIMLVNLSIGFMTPPFAGGLFVACKISQVPYIKLVRECIPFLIIGICVVIITTFVPDIVLFLPKLLATS
jgi:C4-dicarboxylate transporter DctM subunit